MTIRRRFACGLTVAAALPGIDDHPRKKEVTYLRDARTMLRFAGRTG